MNLRQAPYAEDEKCTWKFTCVGHNRTLALPQQVSRINRFSYMAFRGPIDLKHPNLEVGLFEEYGEQKDWGHKVREARKALGDEVRQAHKDKGKEKLIESGLIDEDEGLQHVWLARKVRPRLLPLPATFSTSEPCPPAQLTPPPSSDLRHFPPPDRRL